MYSHQQAVQLCSLQCTNITQMGTSAFSYNCSSKQTFPSQAKYLTRNAVAGSVEAIRNLDDFVLQLAVSHVD